MKRIPTLVWGSVRTNGEKYYLLDDEPIKLKKIGGWQPEGTVCWKVVNSNEYKLQNDTNFIPVYSASLLVFGKEAAIELLDDPQTEILVDYFSDEDNENMAIAPTN